jgi:hypothetical protein
LGRHLKLIGGFPRLGAAEGEDGAAGSGSGGSVTRSCQTGVARLHEERSLSAWNTKRIARRRSTSQASEIAGVRSSPAAASRLVPQITPTAGGLYPLSRGRQPL